jgi:hypothetical protein
MVYQDNNRNEDFNAEAGNQGFRENIDLKDIPSIYSSYFNISNLCALCVLCVLNSSS